MRCCQRSMALTKGGGGKGGKGNTWKPLLMFCRGCAYRGLVTHRLCLLGSVLPDLLLFLFIARLPWPCSAIFNELMRAHVCVCSKGYDENGDRGRLQMNNRGGKELVRMPGATCRGFNLSGPTPTMARERVAAAVEAERSLEMTFWPNVRQSRSGIHGDTGPCGRDRLEMLARPRTDLWLKCTAFLVPKRPTA